MMHEISKTEVRYDAVSRALHGSMALLFVCIYCSAAARYLALDSALDKLLWPTHKVLGLLLFVLLLVRICWSLLRLHYRPKSVSRAAQVGHLALYGFMFVIPFIGLIRQYGSGRAFSAFGLSVFEERAAKLQWMIDLGSNFHGLLGWTLLVLIVGHIGAVVVHHRQGNSQVLRRMFGKTPIV
ncbi:cytochrome b561 [Pseudomonas sp. TE3786]